MAALITNEHCALLKAEKTEKKGKENIFSYLHKYTLDGATNPLHGCMLNKKVRFRFIFPVMDYANNKNLAP